MERTQAETAPIAVDQFLIVQHFTEQVNGRNISVNDFGPAGPGLHRGRRLATLEAKQQQVRDDKTDNNNS
jgi:hypothetical protein